MGAVYLGSTTVGGAVVGLNTVFASVGNALTSFRATVQSELTVIAQATTDLEAQVGAAAAAQVAIRFVAVADFQAQLDAALAIQANLTVNVTDPSVYFQGLITGLLQVQATLQSMLLLPPPDLTASFSAQIAASVALSATLEAKIAAIDLRLEALAIISAALTVIANALGVISVALSAAIDAVVGALTSFATMTASLGVAGVHVFLYTGARSGLGAAIDAVSGSTGLGASADVKVPIILVETSDPTRVAAIDAVFKTA